SATRLRVVAPLSFCAIVTASSYTGSRNFQRWGRPIHGMATWAVATGSSLYPTPHLAPRPPMMIWPVHWWFTVRCPIALCSMTQRYGHSGFAWRVVTILKSLRLQARCSVVPFKRTIGEIIPACIPRLTRLFLAFKAQPTPTWWSGVGDRRRRGTITTQSLLYLWLPRFR